MYVQNSAGKLPPGMMSIQVAPDEDPPTKQLTLGFKHPANSMVTNSQSSFHSVTTQLVDLHQEHGSKKKISYLSSSPQSKR